MGISENWRRDTCCRRIMLYKDLKGAFAIHANDLVPPPPHTHQLGMSESIALLYQTPFAITCFEKMMCSRYEDMNNSFFASIKGTFHKDNSSNKLRSYCKFKTT